MDSEEHTFAVKPLTRGQHYVVQTSGHVHHLLTRAHATYADAARRAEELARATGHQFAVLSVMGVVERREIRPQYDVQWK